MSIRMNRPVRPAARAAVAGLSTTLACSAAFGGSPNNWTADAGFFWHTPGSWSFGSVPGPGTETELQPYFGPNPALIQIFEQFGTARAGSLRARDWNCAVQGCDYDVTLVGIPGGGGRARLHVGGQIRSRADWSAFFGDGESNMSFISLDLRAGSIKIEEENGADATMAFEDVNLVMTGDARVETGFGTVLFLNDTSIRHDDPERVYPFLVNIASSLFVTGTQSTLRDCNLTVNGTAQVIGPLRTETLFGIGSVFANANLVVDGDRNSQFLGLLTGPGALVKEGVGTLTLEGQAKSQSGGLTINGGVVAVPSPAHLGTQQVRFNGGALSPTAPFTITTHPIVLQSGGGELFASTAPMSINPALSGPGALLKTGTSIVALHGASSYAGGTTVADGTLQVNNTSGSGTGSGPVVVETDGRLRGTGAIAGVVTVGGGGTIAPGIVTPFTHAALRTGRVVFENGSTFAVRLSGTDASRRDRMAVSGDVTIDPGATLEVTLTGGFQPQPGDAFLLIDADEIVGEFGQILASGPWCVEATADGLVLRYDAACDVVPCAADVDGDGAVGVSDLLSVLASYGDCPGCPADVNGDDVVDISDLLAILAAWGPCPE